MCFVISTNPFDAVRCFFEPATARVTVGKRLTPDLNVLYSQDLRGTEERILAVEYTLTDRFSLLLTRTDPGTAKTGAERGWAFDVRIRQSR